MLYACLGIHLAITVDSSECTPMYIMDAIQSHGSAQDHDTCYAVLLSIQQRH
jgi:hypothetical protein